LVEGIEAQKVFHGQYDVKVRWTPLGEALAAVANVDASEPNVGPPVRHKLTPRVCQTCGQEYLGKPPSRYCRVECRPLDPRERKVKNHRADWWEQRGKYIASVV
jgi:hypothetical protein